MILYSTASTSAIAKISQLDTLKGSLVPQSLAISVSRGSGGERFQSNGKLPLSFRSPVACYTSHLPKVRAHLKIQADAKSWLHEKVLVSTLPPRLPLPIAISATLPPNPNIWGTDPQDTIPVRETARYADVVEMGEDEATVARKHARGVALAMRREQQGHSSRMETFYLELYRRQVG